MAATGCYAVRPDDGERLTFGSGTVVIKASTPGLTVWGGAMPLLDMPLHVHAREDELFHILRCACGTPRGSIRKVGPGDRPAPGTTLL
jgi:hypothetical protein